MLYNYVNETLMVYEAILWYLLKCMYLGKLLL